MRGETIWFRTLRWFGIIGVLGLGAIAVALSISYWNYANWRENRLEALRLGSKIAYTQTGKIEYTLRGDRGPIMLFLHGSPGGYDAAPKAGPGYRVLTPSRPGYLSTPLETGRTPREQARAYAMLLDALGIREPVLVRAVSGGGPSGIAFAAMYPERTRALIAVSPLSQSRRNTQTVPALLRSDFMLWSALRAVEVFRGNEQTAAVWSLWPISQRYPGWQNDMEQFEHLALPSKTIVAPTLIIHGTADERVPLANSKKLAASILGSRLELIDGGDHLMLAHRDEMETAIQGFLRDNAMTDFLE